MNAPAVVAATAGERRKIGVGVLRAPWSGRLGIPPVVFYALLTMLLAVLVLYPFAVLLTSSFFT